MKGKKGKQISTIAVAGAMSINVLLPYSTVEVKAAENTQDYSNVGGNASDKLLNELNEKSKVSNQDADEINARNLKDTVALKGSINSKGTYTVASNQNYSNMSINADATIWIKKGATLTITATSGGNAGYNNTYQGSQGATALTIKKGVKVTFVGEGTLNITGGTGGIGGYWTSTASSNGSNGGQGGTGGFGISNAGDLNFASTFTGRASINGGVGGTGGRGQNTPNNLYTWASIKAGSGGIGGTGGNAINNSGSITLDTDGSKYNLDTISSFANGNINIKGGKGGTGGTGGNAGIKSREYHVNPPAGYTLGNKVTSLNVGKENKTDFVGIVRKVTTAIPSADTYVLYKNISGNGGKGGTGGYAVSGGTIHIKSGISAMEGGNAGASGVVGTDSPRIDFKGNGGYDYYSSYTTYDWTEYEYIQGDLNPDDGTYGEHKLSSTTSGKVYTVSKKTPSMNERGTTLSGSGNYALYQVKTDQDGGTFYAFSGSPFSGDAIYSGSVTRNGGTFFSGNSSSNGFSGSSNASAFQLAQLEGFEKDTDKDGKIDNKNFYILNANDTYLDANGKLQTAQGIMINGKAYGSKDIFVNPQGYVYLKGVNAKDNVVLQVAIGGERIGDIGSDEKYVTSEAGIYTFTGANGTLQSTFANDNTSMDIDWLAQQMADDFAGSKTGNTVEIDTAYKLAAFSYAVNHGIDGAANAHIKLTSDIDLKAMYWTPIGTKTHPFIGVFDGNSKTIKNMRIKKIDTVNAYGLFGYVKGLQDGKNITSEIKDFTLTNGEYITNITIKTVKYNGVSGNATSGGGYSDYAKFEVDTNGDVYAGAVAGFVENTAFSNIKVENLPMSVNSTTGDIHLGGLVGYAGILNDAQAQPIENTSVANSTLKVNAKQNAYTGGIVGESADIDFTQVYSDTNSNGGTATNSGKQSEANIEVIAGNEVYAGGLIGKAHSTLAGINRNITNSGFNDTLNSKRKITVSASKSTYVGGIAGYSTDIELRSVNVTTALLKSISTDADAYSGGIVGKSDIDKTTYRSITDANVTFNSTSSNIFAQASGDAYLGGIAGYANHTDSMQVIVKDMYPADVVATNGKAYAAGNVAYAQEAIIGNGVITIYGDINVDGKHGAWASGALGYGLEASVTEQNVTMAGIFAKSKTDNPAYAGGVAGQIANGTAEKQENAVLSDNKVLFNTNGISIKAASDGLIQPAFSGGIVGDAVNVNVYDNTVNDENVKSNITVNAFSENGTSYAGGMAGRVDNSKTSKKIRVSNTTINNMSIHATNSLNEASGNEAYGGGIAGKAIADEVVVMNTVVKGTSDVEAKATYDVYAGRLFGHTDRATVLNSAPSAGSNISAESLAGDAYAAGLIGRLDEKIGKLKEKAYQSTIGMSGVSSTNVTAKAGADKTAYAGSLVGDAQNVEIQKSSVNQGLTASGKLSEIIVAGKNAYVGGIGGRIINPDDDQISYMSVSASGVKTTTTAVTGYVKQAGMYGEINNVLIASSFAQNYLNEHDTNADSLYGGLFADAKNIRMIQGYGSRGTTKQNAIDTTGNDAGLAALLSGENQFYGVYSTETNWAYDKDGNAVDALHQGDNNTYKACYYSGSNTPVTASTIWSPTATWGASNYLKTNDLYELKEKDKTARYYDSLSAVTFDNEASRNDVSNAMHNMLHFTANTTDDIHLINISNDQELTTTYEQEVDYRLSYTAKQGNTVNKNFNFPTFSEPYFLTLAVHPGDNYGTVAESSSISAPGSKKFGASTKLNFTALPEDVPEENSFWYEFDGWTIQKRTYDSSGNVILSDASKDVKMVVSGANLQFDMPAYDTVLTANFVQKDNSIRRNINKEIHERSVAEIERRSNLATNDPNYIDPNNIQQNDLKQIFTKMGTDVLGKYVGNKADTYRKNMESTYNKIKEAPYDTYTNYDSLKDPDRVLQQIAANMAENTFASSSYLYVTEDGALSLDELSDVRVDVDDTFTSKGDFKDYVNAQQIVESGTEVKPAIIATQANSDGNLQGVVSALFNGENTSLMYTFEDPATKQVDWTNAKAEGSDYIVPLDSEKAVKADAVYLRNIDVNGFEVITRVPLRKVVSDVNNIKVNIDTANEDLGAAGVTNNGKNESVMVDAAQILKSAKDIEIKGGETDKGNWYYGMGSTTSTAQQTIIHGLPKTGAYLNSFTIEINGKTYTIDENTVLNNSTITLDGVTFTLNGERFKNKNYSSGETLSFPATTSVKVTSNYVNLLGEINASASADTSELGSKQLAAIIAQEHFTDIFMDTTKTVPNDVSNAKKRFDSMEKTELQEVLDKLIQFIPKDALGSTVDYTRAEFIDIFNAVTNIVYVESKLAVDESGAITAIKKDDFTSGTWSNVSDALKKAEQNLSGDFIINDGSANKEAEQLIKSAISLEEAVSGLSYKVQTFTLSTNKEGWTTLSVDEKGSSPALLKSAAVLNSIESELYSNIIKFPYQHSDVIVSFSKQEMDNAGYALNLVNEKGKAVLNEDYSIAAGIENVEVKNEHGKLIVTFKNITNASVYKASFAKKEYTISIPKDEKILSITNSLQKDGLGNPINLEGKDIQVEDMNDVANPTYILHVETEPGYRFNNDATNNKQMASYTYIDASGKEQIAYVKIDEKGNLAIPKEHLSSLADLDISNVVRALGKTDLSDEVMRTQSLYEEKDYTEATYNKWKDAFDKAKEVSVNASATDEEINVAYQNLIQAENQLVRQYEINVATGLMIPDQDGVRILNGKYYVQDGYGVYVQTTADQTFKLQKENKKLAEVSYTKDGSTLSATLKSDGYSAYLPSITTPISNVSFTSKDQQLNIVEGMMKDDSNLDVFITSEIGSQVKNIVETTYHAPDIKASEIENTPVSISAVVRGVNAKKENNQATIVVSGLDSGNKVVKVITADKEEINVALDKTLLDKIKTLIDPSTSESTIVLPGEVVDEILSVLATQRPSQELFGPYALDEVIVVVNESGTEKPATSLKKEEGKKADTSATISATLPSYVITPEDSYATTGLKVDGTDVTLPDDNLIKTIIDHGNKVNNADGSITYTYKDTITDTQYEMISNTKDTSDIKRITISLAEADYDVIFNMDKNDHESGTTPDTHINDTKYGEAVVSWNTPDTNAHVVEGMFKKKVFEVNTDSITGGKITADRNEVIYGKNVSFTLEPNTNQVIEPSANITIEMNGKTITGNLEQLSVQDELVVDITKDADGAITSVTILAKDNRDNITVIASDSLFRSNQVADILNDQILPSLEKLKDKVDIVEAIVAQKDSSPYISGDAQYKQMIKENEAAKHLLDKLTNEDGSILDAIAKATSEKDMLQEIEKALGKETIINSIGDVQNKLNDTADSVQQAIENLNAKDESKRKEQIVITLPDNVVIATDAIGIDTSEMPKIQVVDKNDPTQIIADNSAIATDDNQNLVINDIHVLPGNDLSELMIKVKDPSTNEVKEVSIPLINNSGNNDQIQVTIKDASGKSETKTIAAPGIYPIVMNTDGSNSIKLPGDSLNDIFKASFGNDVIAGMIEEIKIEKTTAKKEMEISRAEVSIDNGIKESTKPAIKTNETTSGTTTTNTVDADDKITLNTEGITIENIEVKDDFTLKGTTISVVDDKNDLHQIFIPSTTTNTKNAATGSGKDMIITSNDLQKAIKEQILDPSIKLDDLSVVDVTLNTFAPIESNQTAISDSESVNGFVLKTKDTSGKEVVIIVPVDNDKAPDKVSVQYDEGGATKTIEVPLVNVKGTISTSTNTESKATVNISGSMVEDILAQIANTSKDKVNIDINAEINSHTELLTKRVANELPQNITAGKGIQSKLDKTTSLITSDGKGSVSTTADNKLIEGDEHLLIENIESSNGYVFDGVDLNIKGINDAKETVEKQVQVSVLANGSTVVHIDGKEITLPTNSLTIITPDDSHHGSIDFAQSALETLYKECGIQKNADDIYEADITEIIVNAILNDKKAISVPTELDEKASHNLDKDTKVDITITPTIVVADIKIGKDNATDKLYIPVDDVNGTKVNVIVDYTDPNDPHIYVVADGGKTTVEIAFPQEWKDAVKSESGKIEAIPGNVLQDIINAYNEIAVKDVILPSGVENTGTIPLEFPKLMIGNINDGKGNDIIADVAGNTFIEGALTGNEDVTMYPVKVKPAHQLEDVVVVAKDKAGNEIIITMPIAPNPESSGNTVNVIVKDKDTGTTKEYSIVSDELAKIAINEKDGKEITLPGSLVKDIIEETVEKDHKENPSSSLSDESEITSVSIDAVREGIHVPNIATVDKDGTSSTTQADISIITRKEEKATDEAVLLPKTTDLLIKNIHTEEGYRADGVSLTLKDGSDQEYKVAITIPTKEGKIDVILPNGSHQELPIKSDKYPEGIDLSELAMKEGSSDEIRIPGKSIQEIMEKLSKSAPVDMDITAVNVHVSETSWQLPLSEQIVTSSNATDTAGIDEIASIIISSNGKNESSLITTDEKLSVDKNGSFVMKVAYGEDDYSSVNSSSKNFIHQYNGLQVNGVTLSKKQLNGIVVELADGSLEIDTAKLTKKIEEISKKEFKGFSEIHVQTIPQNPQYKTFKNEFLALESMDTSSTEYEAMVKKLLSQFDEKTAISENPDILSMDNKSHLINYKADLQTRQDKIDEQKQIDDIVLQIKDIYEEMDIAVDAVDGNTKYGLPFIYNGDDATDRISGATIIEVENYRNQIEALEKEYLNLDSETRKAVADKVAGKRGEANKLDQMLDAVEAVDIQTLGKAGVVNKLLDKLLNETLVDIVDDNDDPSNADSYTIAKGKVQNLDDTTRQINKINNLIISMSSEELKNVSTSQRQDLEHLQIRVNDEYTDFANLFVKEFLTQDHKVYKPGSDGSSATSENGYTQDTYKTKSNETKKAVINAKEEFNKLSDATKNAIGVSVGASVAGVFHGPTLNELFESVVDPVNAVDVLIDEIDDHYEKLIANATTQQEKEDLQRIHDEAVAKLESGKDKKQESFAKDALGPIVNPDTDSELGTISYAPLERRAETLTAQITYVPDGAATVVNATVNLAYKEDGSVDSLSITKDGVLETPTLTDDLLVKLKQTTPSATNEGSIMIAGTVLEEILGIRDHATDKAFTQIDISFASLSVGQLTKVSEDAIERMDTVTKNVAKQTLQEEMQALKDKVKDILGEECITLLEEQFLTGQQLIDKSDAIDAHILKNAQIDRMREIVLAEIKKQLAEEFANLAQNISADGYDKLLKAYENALNELRNSKDDIDGSLSILQKAKQEMEDIYNGYPKIPVNPNNPGTPTTPSYPESNTGTQGVSRPGSSSTIYEVIYDGVVATIKKKGDTKTSVQKLKDEYERITKAYAGLKGNDGYQALQKRLQEVYEKALKDIEKAPESDREAILQKALSKMSEIEAKFKELRDSTSSTQANVKQSSKAAWFNIFALLALFAGAVFAFIRRHRYTAVLGIDLLAGIILIAVTQGFVLKDMATLNAYSIWFVLLAAIDVVLLVGFRKKKNKEEK